MPVLLPQTSRALRCALVAAALAAVVAWLGPPGTDVAAHAYQRGVFLEHGFALWNNFWYAGRYSFVTYSVLYYPLAALFGLRLLAVLSIAAAAFAFALLVDREWGHKARWSVRAFAVVWAGVVLSGAYPFALGAPLALAAILALQRGRRVLFAALGLLTLAASPLAFLFLAVLLAGVAAAKRTRPGLPAAAMLLTGSLEILLWRLFPDSGHYPFSRAEFAAASMFCVLGAALSWRVEPILRFVFLAYLAACTAIFFVPSAIGENIARLRFAAIPLAVLVLALRSWRPRMTAVVAFVLAASWNVTPLAVSYANGMADPASNRAYWEPAIAFLHSHLTPSYRVEAVDTVGHWDAVYLPRAGIPLVRGWYRQDDFPQNRVLYSPLASRGYVRWLRRLGVRYVLLTRAPPDYSARGEADLLESGRSGLQAVLVTTELAVYEVPDPKPLVAPPAVVTGLTQTRVDLALPSPGRYRLAVRYSPYWRPSAGCVERTADGMVLLTAWQAGAVGISFDLDADTAFQALTGPRRACAR